MLSSVSTNNDYAYGDERDRYQNFVHAVYKKYDLPHIEEYAKAGETEMEIAELTRGMLTSQVALQHAFKENKKERGAIRSNVQID